MKVLLRTVVNRTNLFEYIKNEISLIEISPVSNWTICDQYLICSIVFQRC